MTDSSSWQPRPRVFWGGCIHVHAGKWVARLSTSLLPSTGSGRACSILEGMLKEKEDPWCCVQRVKWNRRRHRKHVFLITFSCGFLVLVVLKHAEPHPRGLPVHDSPPRPFETGQTPHVCHPPSFFAMPHPSALCSNKLAAPYVALHAVSQSCLCFFPQ